MTIGIQKQLFWITGTKIYKEKLENNPLWQNMSPQNEPTILNKAPASMHSLFQVFSLLTTLYWLQQNLHSTDKEDYYEEWVDSWII
jgi:hypothetical protein